MNSPATFEYYFTLQHNGRARVRTPFHCLISISAVAALCILAIGPKSAKGQAPAESVASSPAQIRALKITVLSTMLVGDAILTHNHGDHVGGLMPLRREMMKKNPAALSVAHVSRGIFYSRPSAKGEQNEMIGIRKDYEASGGKCIEHTEGFDIFPGAWLTGPVPRKYPERNWSPGGKVQTPSGLIEDNIPEDQSLVLNTSRGLVVLTGCGHAGIINILTYAKQRFPNQPAYGVVGGLHLFAASDEQLNWTGDKLKEFRVANLLGAHCTGIEAVYRLRERAGLTRKSAIVGTVGSMFTLSEAIRPGVLAK